MHGRRSKRTRELQIDWKARGVNNGGNNSSIGGDGGTVAVAISMRLVTEVGKGRPTQSKVKPGTPKPSRCLGITIQSKRLCNVATLGATTFASAAPSKQHHPANAGWPQPSAPVHGSVALCPANAQCQHAHAAPSPSMAASRRTLRAHILPQPRPPLPHINPDFNTLPAQHLHRITEIYQSFEGGHPPVQPP